MPLSLMSTIGDRDSELLIFVPASSCDQLIEIVPIEVHRRVTEKGTVIEKVKLAITAAPEVQVNRRSIHESKRRSGVRA